MNSVERGGICVYVLFCIVAHEPPVVVQYSSKEQIPQESPHDIEDKKPDPSWPQHGSISFDKITMSYRPGLPNVLKGISLDVKGGEKIGVVGR